MIELRNVSKSMKKNLILNQISYTFKEGMVYGLYGENGSGKTMLLRAIAGLLVPDEGEIISDGQKLHKEISFPNNTGIVIEHMELLPRFTARENLRLLSKIKKKATDDDITDALEAVGLDPYSVKKVKKFSLGMKQRLNIAQAVFEKQNVILLDEPTNALDEEGVKKIYALIEREKERGALIIIATHHKADLQHMCDVILKMSGGRLLEE